MMAPTTAPTNLTDELHTATGLARAAGALVAEQYGKVERLLKRQNEAVTEADRASQRLIVTGLHKKFPGDGIVGEENETGDAITFVASDEESLIRKIEFLLGRKLDRERRTRDG